MKRRPWLRGLGWLSLLGPVFFLSYNFANRWASRRRTVGALMFPWEKQIPFLAWTSVPYWSSDVLYALSLMTCRNRAETDLLGKRLLAIQAFSVACFLAFPLRCTYQRPPVTGLSARLFGALEKFDLPYNQAPSLHVALAVILWVHYRERTGGLLRAMLAAWFVLVAVSSVTTWQHHFIDVLTGAWAGLLVLAALPEKPASRLRLAPWYLSGALLCTIGAFALRGLGWLLLWPAFALSMVAAAYWTGDEAWMRVRIAMLPYTAAAWINSRLWTRGQEPRNHLADSVWIGRAPFLREREGMNSVVALAPELAVRADASIAMLDLTPPTSEQLEAAVNAILRLADQRPTLVCCALGYSRSALAAAAWLMAAGHAETVSDALERVRRARPQIVVRPEFERSLQQWAESRK